MYIEHLAIWCRDLEAMKTFYCRYFGAVSNARYHNPSNGFYSYFLSFEKGPRLELMQMPGIPDSANDVLAQFTGLIHFAVSVGSEEKVNQLTEKLRADGIQIVGEPRKTGDGYYESAVLDIEGNRIEITV
jgi:lactoylglutathione lyase